MMSESLYDKKIEWLFNQLPVFQKIGEKAFKPTLHNTIRLIELLQIPYQEMKFVHVAGTNGKGTTCSIIASVLQEQGKKVGLFTSPHIKDFRERIRVNGGMIDKKRVIELIEKVQSEDLSFSPSFFEMTWVFALYHFYQEECDIVVVETGLGGRLDATNVITPELCVVTNIGLDHIQILGDTRQAVAREKAGIIKENIPIILGESDEEVLPVFQEVAKQKKAPLTVISAKETATVFELNQQMAFVAIDFLLKDDPQKEEYKKAGLHHLRQNTGLYGRNQVISSHPLIIADAAHNREGVVRFIADIQKRYPQKNIYALYAASNDKDVEGIIELFPKEWTYLFTQFSSKRAFDIEELKQVNGVSELNSTFFENSLLALKKLKSIDNELDVGVVFGSFYLLEEII